MLKNKLLFHKRQKWMLRDKLLFYKREVDVKRQAVVIEKGNKQAVVIEKVRDKLL
jgi:hypothetical protein